MAPLIPFLLVSCSLILGQDLAKGFGDPLLDPDQWGDSSLHAACREDSVQAVEAVLNSTALDLVSSLVNSRGRYGHTPLIAAAVVGSEAIVRLLLSHGADVHVGDSEGYSALDAAAFHGRARVVGILVRAGLSPNELHPDGYAPLHRAAWGLEKRHTETTRALLSKGHVMVRSRDGRTAQEMTKNRATLRVLKAARRQSERREGGPNLLYVVVLLPLGVLVASWTATSRIRSGKPPSKLSRRRPASTPSSLATIGEEDELDETILLKKVN